MSTCDHQIESSGLNNPVVNASTEDIDRMTVSNIKVYKRRWYILMLFTLLNATGNILWNTWPPVQETCQLVFGWNKTNLLIIGALQALGSIISIVPSAWLLDTKGELQTCLFSFLSFVNPCEKRHKFWKNRLDFELVCFIFTLFA